MQSFTSLSTCHSQSYPYSEDDILKWRLIGWSHGCHLVVIHNVKLRNSKVVSPRALYIHTKFYKTSSYGLRINGGTHANVMVLLMTLGTLYHVKIGVKYQGETILKTRYSTFFLLCFPCALLVFVCIVL
jgi:hypothetical protein